MPAGDPVAYLSTATTERSTDAGTGGSPYGQRLEGGGAAQATGTPTGFFE